MADDPANWRTALDQASKKYYYYNKKTGETTWTKPKCLEKSAPEKKAGTSAPASQPKKKSAWRCRLDPKVNKVYYYNKSTNVSTWTKPDDYDGPTPPDVKKDKPVEQPKAAEPEPQKKAASPKKVMPKVAEATGKKTARDLFGSSDEEEEPEQVFDGDDEEEEQEAAVQDTSNVEVDFLKEGLTLRQVLLIRAKKFNVEKEIFGEEQMSESDSDNDDDHAATGYTFTKHRKGFFNRLLRIGHIFDDEELLSFKKSLIKKSLLKTNRALDDKAIQMFKNIMSFMGDRKSGKKAIDHARKIMRNCLKAPNSLRDETFLQLCKQTHKNPYKDHAAMGWNLMNVCLCSFPPSKNIKIIDYINRTITEQKNDPGLRARAELARVLLPLIEKIGKREQIPPTVEIEMVSKMKLIPVSVHLCDGKQHEIKVDPFATVAELERTMSRKLNVKYYYPFGLYEANKDSESLLDGSQRVMDVISSWETALVPDEDEKAIDTQKKSGKQDEEEHQEPKVVYTHLVYKAKLCLRTSGKEALDDLLADPNAIHLLYVQAQRNVVQSRTPHVEKDICKLAALQLQVDENDYQSDIHKPGFLFQESNVEFKLREYLPRAIVGTKGEKVKKKDVPKFKMYEQKVIDKYRRLKGFTAHGSKLNYLDYVEDWPSYGAQFFPVEQRQFKNFPKIINLGVAPDGILLQHRETKEILRHHKYRDIVTWGHSETKFILVTGDVVQARKLVFKTVKGEILKNLIHDYIKFKVQSKMTGK